MTDKVMENNQVTVMGEIVGEFVYSHEIFGEGFYMVDILVPRLSDSSDRIPLMISERLMDVSKDYRGTLVMVSGQFRSYNRHEEHRNRLILSVFVREVAFIEQVPENEKTNYIFLDGFICKEPVYWKRNRGYFAGCEPSIRKKRLHPVHQLGQKCQICESFQGWGTLQDLGKDPEPRVHEKDLGGAGRKTCGI